MTDNELPTDDARTAPRRPVSRRVGMREVADRAGVAISSVSRVISNHPDASDAMKERVLAAIDELGFRPDMLAQTLRTGSSRTVGFIAADIGNPLFAQIAVGAESALRDRGYSMILANSLGDPSRASDYVLEMESRRVDGLLISVSDETDEALQSALGSVPFPVVLIDRELPGDYASVVNDHAAGMQQAIDHLVQLGHEHIALVNGPAEVRPSRERARTLREAAGRQGIRPVVSEGHFEAQHGHDATVELLRRDPRPTAVIAGSNQILVGVLRALRELGLRAPDDVSLVTCDDAPMSEFLDPALTTISRDPSALGGAAAELLLAVLAGGRGDTVTLPTGLRVAASSAAPAHLASASKEHP